MLGAAELGALMGVSRQRVTQLTAKPWFPAPAARLAMGAVWQLADIQVMADGTGRELDYPALQAHLDALEERHQTDPRFAGLL
jgi:hypothetical protein